MIEIKIKIPFSKKTIEIKNSNLANPQEWLKAILSRSTETAAGINVNEKESLQVSVVYACVKVISETVAYLNCNLFKRTDRGKEKAINHELHHLLHYLPNPETTSFEFWVMYLVNFLLTGDAFAYIKRDRNGKVIEIWNIPTKNVEIYRNDKTKELLYEVYDPFDDKKVIYYSDNIMHTRGMRFDDKDTSLNTIKTARESIGLGLALERYASKYFGNGAQVGGIVEYEGALSDVAFNRFKDEFRKNYQGVVNSNKIMFLEQGSKFAQVTNKPDESQALESRQFQVIEVCRFFNVPPHKIMDLTRATFSNIEHQNIDFVQTCISPVTLRIEQTIYKDLLSTKRMRELYFAKFNTNSLLRGDINSRREYYNTMLQNGVLSPNDVRTLEDMNTYEDGNIYMVNGNMIAVKDVEKGGEKDEN